MKKKYVSNNKKQRVILSDILPYEIPVIFSNRYFYRFLVENQISIKEEGKKFIFTYNQVIKNNGVIDKFLTLFMAEKPDSAGKFDNCNSKTIPFKFKIAHKGNDYRELSIIHPINQMLSIEFYDEYKELIPYYASVSKFSLRAPHQIAKLGYYNDHYHRLIGKINNDSSNIEMQNQEEEHLKSFFTYRKYSNIYKFFESPEYHDCEKRFNYLYQFDIQKCFDSIYTHTLAWALLNKQAVKDNLGKEKPTLAGKFDKLMQDMNYGETNGILIGSETSRIFAELLLQKIDKQVLESLNNDGITYKKDYEIFRYVDDYFVFYTSDNTKKQDY